METKLSFDQMCDIPSNVVLSRPMHSLIMSWVGIYSNLLFLGGADPGSIGTLGESSLSFVRVLWKEDNYVHYINRV